MSPRTPPQGSSARHRLTFVWLGLMAATVASWATGHRASLDSGLVSAIVIGVAFIKVRFVGLDFMELRTAPLPLRIAFEIWLLVACTALILLALGGTAASG